MKDGENENRNSEEEKRDLDRSDILAFILAILWNMLPLFLFAIFLVVIAYVFSIILR